MAAACGGARPRLRANRLTPAASRHRQVYNEEIQQQVADLFQALADEAISTGVDLDGNLIESTIEVLSPSP